MTFDTLEFVRRLDDAGVPERKAEAEVIKQAFQQALDTEVARKSDIIGQV